MLCYCNSNKAFSACCEPLLRGKQQATTAEQLMRSRYSAYVVADISYLMNSHHPLTRPTKERKSIAKWTKAVTWMGLEIISKQKGEPNDNEGYVTFKALFIENGEIENIHENSYFVKENNTWYYKSGKHTNKS
jgi:SEC-C motif-containing protein